MLRNADVAIAMYRLELNESSGIKRGEEIFAGTDYPHDWDGFIGQTQAKEQLQVQVASALARGTRPEHTLLESGMHGVGKTTLATILAYQVGAGFLQTSGPLAVDKARELFLSCSDRDIVFIDEAHKLVEGNRTRADWLLPFMTEGVLYTSRGPESMPDIAIVAATTDAGKMPQTLLSRFMCVPTLVAYTPDEATEIALNLSDRMKVDLRYREDAEEVANAADSNPRMMRRILTAVRDLQHVFPDTHPNLAKALEYAGVSADGLTQIARDILLVLLTSPDTTASIDSINAHLGEPGPLKHHEQALLQRQLLHVTGRGRKLTERGLARARSEARQRLA